MRQDPVATVPYVDRRNFFVILFGWLNCCNNNSNNSVDPSSDPSSDQLPSVIYLLTTSHLTYETISLGIHHRRDRFVGRHKELQVASTVLFVSPSRNFRSKAQNRVGLNFWRSFLKSRGAPQQNYVLASLHINSRFASSSSASEALPCWC